MSGIEFSDHKGTFTLDHPDDDRTLYFPIGNENGVKGAVTPYMGGDLKLDQNTFVLEPTSVENLHNNRSSVNFWCITEDGEAWSACGCSAEAEAEAFSEDRDSCRMQAGFLWQEVERVNRKKALSAKVLSFVPCDDNVELMTVTLCNQGKKDLRLACLSAVPIYGRSADNLRDHRHVTSLLHRTVTTEYGVQVHPTLSFDERGHKKNQMTYYVCGITGDGKKPAAFYPTVEGFLGSRGSFLNPEALHRIAKAMKDPEGIREGKPAEPEKIKAVGSGYEIAGRESLGGILFDPFTLKAGETRSFTLLIGATPNEDRIEEQIRRYQTASAVTASLEKTKAYWQKKVNLSYHTGNDGFDGFLKWVSFQPFLRKIYGCSFLPHHDYGKGGRGWRDLWQDCLSLLIMDPSEVGEMIENNFGGVRIDGTNATIIGSKPGEFIADRNNITRVWMDHGMWPFLTTRLYIEQTGDWSLLTRKAPYFKDPQISRGREKDETWQPEDGNRLKTESGDVYLGSIFEHLLLQHLTAACEVGEHGNILLRGADWNDALDMAGDKGESVAFTCAYAGNLRDLAAYAGLLEQKGIAEMDFPEEFAEFITALEGRFTAQKKREALDVYLKKVGHRISGSAVRVSMDRIASVLEGLAGAFFEEIRACEWVGDGQDSHWFNSYYDNHGNRVEGNVNGNIRMMLTGQVFSVMSGVADADRIAEIAKSTDKYLFDPAIGGYRLNTDFKEEKYDMGRMFGFAYGEKENGAVFSHMAVMYAYAMYRRGFVKEGYKALQALADAAMNFETSRIYPGIPEYFNNDGRGLYHYLTGAASWYALTMVTLVFGAHGRMGALCLEPKLTDSQFDRDGKAELDFTFAGHEFRLVYDNPGRLTYGGYRIFDASLDGVALMTDGKSACISADRLKSLDTSLHTIKIRLA